jgi:hypothetical protein
MNPLISSSHRLRLALEPGLCAGDWVEVKSKEEILESLDEKGTLDGMPFMPEMLEYCGRRFRVYKRAHKTCDFSQGMQARRISSAVHLEGLRCSGAAHGGCQAECLLFWREAWLKPADAPGATPNGAGQIGSGQSGGEHRRREGAGCTEEQLYANTLESAEGEPAYLCQGTTILRFSTPLRASELDQYVEACTSGGVRLREMPAPLLFRVYERLVWSRLGRTGIPQRVYDAFQKLRGGIPYPNRPGLVPDGTKTPKGTPLNLQPGDFVRVKSFKEIRETLNRDAKNRGLLFSQELVPYCGRICRVHSRVNRIIDEKSRKMLHFSNDCIILEDVVCLGRYNAGLAFCPRANYPYWREIWLERVAPDEVPANLLAGAACDGSGVA